VPTLERRIGAQRPRICHLPPDRISSAGQDAIDLAATCGLILDDWQSWTIDHMLSERADGSWCAPQAALIVPRQAGKGAILEALELAALFLFDEQRIIHTAHLADTAAAHMQRMVNLIAQNPELDKITYPYFSNGKERIERTDNGGRIEFVTRGRKTKRGASPQRLIFDEALFLTDEQIQSILPALSAQSMNDDGGPQIIYMSSAPLPESVVLHRVRQRGISANAGRMFFAEWSCEEGVDINDRDAWYSANPGMGIRISEEWVEENELTTMSREAFLIERLGVVTAADGPSKVLANWAACFDETPCPKVPVRVALSVSPGGVSAAFTVCGARSDKLSQVEVQRHEAGTWWVVDEAVRATKALGVPLTVDPRSPSAGVLADLVAARVPLQELSTADYTQACAGLQVAVANLAVRHIGQPALDAAVAGADVRPVGDGGWAWSRKSSSVDIAPLESMTLALWSQMGASKPKSRYVSLEAALAAAEKEER